MSKTSRAALIRSNTEPASSLPRAPASILQRFLVQPGFLLARIDQICTAIYGELSSEETLAQAEFLLLLAKAGELDQISLARAAGVDTSTTALVLSNLVGRELVARKPDPADRRRAKLCLTARGRKQLVRTREAFSETQKRLIAPLEETEVSELMQVLRQIGANPMSPAPLWVPGDRRMGIGENIVTSSPAFLCRRALQVCEAYFLTCVASLSLTPRQFSVLYILNLHPGLTQVGFARLFGIDPATSAVIMKNLFARGLLARNPSAEDRRERIYSLTPAGRRVLAAAQPLADKADRLVLRSMSRADIRRLVQRLQHIVRAHSARLRFPGALFSD